MKLKSTIALCSALGLSVVAHAQESKAAAPAAGGVAPAAAAAAEYTEDQIIEEFGWFIGKRVGLSELEFGKAEMDSLVKGLGIAAANKESPYDLEKIGPLMDEFMIAVAVAE